MRSFRARLLIGSLVMMSAVGCEVIAGLQDHQLITTTGSDASSDGATTGEGSSGPGFTITASPELAVLPGASGSVVLTVTRAGGFTDAINVNVSGLPASVSTDNPQIKPLESTATLTFTVAAGASQSVSHVTIHGASADGKITASVPMDFLVRGPPGSLDLTYGTAGSFTSTALIPLGAALDANDTLAISGVTGLPPLIFAAIRIASDGTPDKQFGVISQTLPDGAHNFAGVFPLTTGNVIFAGNANSGADYLRVTPTGAFDPTYSADGGIGYLDDTAVSTFGCDSTGRIIAAGSVMQGGLNELLVERRLVSGAADPSFSAATHEIGVNTSQVTDLIVQPDGLPVVVSDAVGSTFNGFALNRFTTSGGFDSAFGNNGYVEPFNTATFGHLALAADGSIFVIAIKAGNPVVAHVSAAGIVDAAFGTSGLASVPGGVSIAAQPDGKVIVAGNVASQSDGGGYELIQVERLTTAGQPDATFGSGGFVTSMFGVASLGGADAVKVVIQGDGRIVVVAEGTLMAGKSPSAIVARYWP
jgi:uncharacterized delta-60 repeat protein